jgi:hypothetical protein
VGKCYLLKREGHVKAEQKDNIEGVEKVLKQGGGI